MVDAYLAAAVLAGVALNGWLGWWRAGPLAGLVISITALAKDAKHGATRANCPALYACRPRRNGTDDGCLPTVPEGGR
jgi:hypothetical protein